MGLTVRVTKADITNGVRKNPYACPIALAIRRQLSLSGHEVLAGVCGILVFRHGRLSMTLSTTKRAAEFIFAFDRRKPVKPATFTMRES